MWSAATMVLQLPLLFLLLLISSCAAQGPRFQCGSTSRCPALAGYVARNRTTYDAIRSLFQVESLVALYGANGINATTPGSTRVPDNTTVRVPFSCACANGTGISDGGPFYTVMAGNDLDMIAREIFQALVTFQQIAAVSRIPNPALIQPGQRVRIPLPCSCDAADGGSAVHLAHIVKSKSSVAGIAAEFGTTEATLLRINNMSSPNDLLAGQILDVPLRACNSSIRSDSSDYPLRLPNGSYALTAGNCVMCSCDSLTGGQLLCEMAPDLNLTQTLGCPRQTCSAAGDFRIKVPLGSMLVTSCASTRCDYAGYNALNGGIIEVTTVVNQSFCGTPPPGSAAHSLWPGPRPLLVFFHAALLLLAFL